MYLKDIILTIGITSIILDELEVDFLFLKQMKKHTMFKYFYIYAYTFNMFDNNTVALNAVVVSFIIKNREFLLKILV